MKTKPQILFFVIFFLSELSTNAQNAASVINSDSMNTVLVETLIKQKIDSVRKVFKLKSLTNSDTLKKAADDQVQYVKKKKQLTHYQTENSKKKTISDRLAYYGLSNTYAGENVAYTYIFTKINNHKGGTYINTTYENLANDFVTLWVKSKGHFENLTDEEFELTAVAVSYDKKTKIVYALQNFSSKK
jgi:uncharacterized protein YkwD